MNCAATRILLVFFSAVLLISCSENPFTHSPIFTGETRLPNPPKEILVSDSRFDRPYTMLGPIEITQKKYSSVFTDKIELRKQAIAMLKQEALARYGNKVDAIIDTQVTENTLTGYDDAMSVTHVQGIAIAFDTEKKPTARRSIKRKVSSPTHKAKSSRNTARETRPRDIEITPSEILK